MKKRKVEEVIHTIRYDWEDAPLKVCDIPKDLLPDDKIYCISDPGYYSENNSWDAASTEYKFIRMRLQTDEEFQKEVDWWEKKKEESRKERYETYLKLKKEFEEGLLTKHGYKMSPEEKKHFDNYSDMKFNTHNDNGNEESI